MRTRYIRVNMLAVWAGVSSSALATGRADETGPSPEATPSALERPIFTASSNSPPDDGVKPASRREDWHIDFGVRFGYTKLGSTKQQLDRRLDLPLKLDVLGFFDSPHTPLDSKSELTLNTLYAGIGRQPADWLSWTVYVGGGYANDHTHQRTLNVNLTTEFKYLALYTGVALELYPWGQPKHQEYADWSACLRAGKPYLLAGGEIGYVSASGRGEYAIAPFRIYEDSVEIRDWLFSLIIGVGWQIPLDDRWSINIALDHAFHLYRPEEYDTWNLHWAFRYRS
ncbi:MAG: hypothetical protein ACE5HE_08380 [Phycisphaerae bacterium]